MFVPKLIWKKIIDISFKTMNLFPLYLFLIVSLIIQLIRTRGLVATTDVRFSKRCCAETERPKWISFGTKLGLLVDPTYKLKSEPTSPYF